MFTNFCRGVYKLLPWCLQTFAVVFTNFCRDVYKLLPWRLQTFAVVLTKFCRGVYKLLPWCSQTFVVVFTNFCRDVHKLLPWCSQTFVVVFTNFSRLNKLSHWISRLSVVRTRGLEAFTRMIFFKFSGISLVSVGRARPGNEIKSKWWMLFFKGKRKPCCYDRSLTELSWILITWKLSLWTVF